MSALLCFLALLPGLWHGYGEVGGDNAGEYWWLHAMTPAQASSSIIVYAAAEPIGSSALTCGKSALTAAAAEPH